MVDLKAKARMILQDVKTATLKSYPVIAKEIRVGQHTVYDWRYERCEMPLWAENRLIDFMLKHQRKRDELD
jgi:hypothetical protein